jgi:hypothetical protein
MWCLHRETGFGERRSAVRRTTLVIRLQRLWCAYAFSFHSHLSASALFGADPTPPNPHTGFAVPLPRAASSTAVSGADSAAAAAAAPPTAMGNAIKVIVRVRPFSADEVALERKRQLLQNGDEKEPEPMPTSAVQVMSGQSLLLADGKKGTTKQHTFDSVLAADSTQVCTSVIE